MRKESSMEENKLNTTEVSAEKKETKLKAINPMFFLVIIILLCALASYIVPAGTYERVFDAVSEREIVDPNSFHYIDQNPVSLFSLLMSVTLGMQNAAYVIFFLLIIGGTFAVLDATGAINAGMANVVKKTRGKELLMIPICMIVFGCGSCFAGNFEEFLAFVPLVLACCLTMGFDSLTAVGSGRLRRSHDQRIYSRCSPEYRRSSDVFRYRVKRCTFCSASGCQHCLCYVACGKSKEKSAVQLRV